MTDQTGLNNSLQANWQAYNPDTSAQQAQYLAQRAQELGKKTPDQKQIQAKRSTLPQKKGNK